jgi:succinyl-CoA synthetase alpha subunit
MAILIDETKRVLVQGITGREGQALLLRKLARSPTVTTVTT